MAQSHTQISALLHHLQALEELPADVIIPPRLVVSRKSGEAILEQLEKPAEPTDSNVSFSQTNYRLVQLVRGVS